MCSSPPARKPRPRFPLETPTTLENEFLIITDFNIILRKRTKTSTATDSADEEVHFLENEPQFCRVEASNDEIYWTCLAIKPREK